MTNTAIYALLGAVALAVIAFHPLVADLLPRRMRPTNRRRRRPPGEGDPGAGPGDGGSDGCSGGDGGGDGGGGGDD